MSRVRDKPSKRPWYPRYVVDYNTDPKVLAMSWAERGFYDFLLDMQWSEGSIPADRRQLARLARLGCDDFEREFGLLVDTCFDKDVTEPNRLRNAKLERVREQQCAFSEQQRERANKRYESGTSPAEEPQESGSTKIKSETLPPGEKDQTTIPLPGKPTAAQRRVVDRWREVAEPILASLNEARKRVRNSSRGISPSYDALALIAERLEGGASAADCLHVVEVCEAECRANQDSFRWFDAVTPFRRENFVRKCAADPALASAASTASHAKGHAPVSSFADVANGVDIAHQLRKKA